MTKKYNASQILDYISNLFKDSNIRRELSNNDIYLVLTLLSKYKNINFKLENDRFTIEEI